jgi:hypothetical protein
VNAVSQGFLEESVIAVFLWKTRGSMFVGFDSKDTSGLESSVNIKEQVQLHQMHLSANVIRVVGPHKLKIRARIAFRA